MSNFEKVAASPKTLGAFLSSLPIATGPWDELFHRQFCDACKREVCGTPYCPCDICDQEICGTPHCPYEAMRNNPTWWLYQGGKPGEVPGLTIKVNAAFPVEWDREYYTVEAAREQARASCVCCDDTGKVTIIAVPVKMRNANIPGRFR